MTEPNSSKNAPTDPFKYPDHELADLIHELSLSKELCSDERKKQICQKLLNRISEEDSSHFYKHICEAQNSPVTLDPILLEKLQNKNKAELESIDTKIEDAKANLGDSEVRESMLEKAHFYCRIGDKETAIDQYSVCHDKAIGTGSRLDTILATIRIGLFYGDVAIAHKNIDRAKLELEKGGDWERRNKLKVYEAVKFLMCREFTCAANLFADSIATFTATELFSFKSLVFYTIISSMLSFDRATLKEKVIDCPEIVQVLEDDPALRQCLLSYYNCTYYTMMINLIPLAQCVRKDRYLGAHYRYFIRNFRLKAYTQFLEPYKSVTLASMAEAFGVSPDFMEMEIANFVSSRKLSCKIDRVGGVIESNQPDVKNRQYIEILKHGDILLNRVQKLSRVIYM